MRLHRPQGQSGGWSGLVLLAQRLKLVGGEVELVEAMADGHQLVKDGAQQLLGGGRGGVEHLHRHLLDPQHVAGKTGHLIGVKHQGLLDIPSEFWVELAGIEGGIDVARIGVGVPIHGGARAVERLLYLINSNQIFRTGIRLTRS